MTHDSNNNYASNHNANLTFPNYIVHVRYAVARLSSGTLTRVGNLTFHEVILIIMTDAWVVKIIISLFLEL